MLRHYRKPTKLELAEWAEDRHKAGRGEYDTPGSVIYCACQSCQDGRKLYGKPTIRNRVRILILESYDYFDGVTEHHELPVWKR